MSSGVEIPKLHVMGQGMMTIVAVYGLDPAYFSGAGFVSIYQKDMQKKFLLELSSIFELW